MFTFHDVWPDPHQNPQERAFFEKMTGEGTEQQAAVRQQGQQSLQRRYCCFLTSRTATIVANVWLFLVGVLYTIVAFLSLTQETEQLQKAGDLPVVWTVLVASFLQMGVSAAGLRGAVTYQAWLVKWSSGWVFMSTGLLLFLFLIQLWLKSYFNILMLLSIVIQVKFFYAPQVGFIYEVERGIIVGPSTAGYQETATAEENDGLNEFVDDEEENKSNMEMV